MMSRVVIILALCAVAVASPIIRIKSRSTFIRNIFSNCLHSVYLHYQRFITDFLGFFSCTEVRKDTKLMYLFVSYF